MLDNKKTLSPKCKKMLQKRLEMYKNAAQVSIIIIILRFMSSNFLFLLFNCFKIVPTLKIRKVIKCILQFAPAAPPENFQQLYSEVVTSPSKQYFFLIIMMFLGTIFIIGILCGRLNQRKYMLLKSK